MTTAKKIERLAFQDSVLAEIAEGLNLESEPPEVGDFGFHYPYRTVALTVTILKASGYKCWPDAGGLLDQDSYWIADIMQYLAIERRIEFEQKALNAEGDVDDDPDIVKEELFR